MELTHLPLDKMATTLADDNFKCIFLNENDRIPIRFSLKFVPPRNPIDSASALIQVMTWSRTGDKPLPEPTLTQFIDTYVQHQGEMSSLITCPHDLIGLDEMGNCPWPYLLINIGTIWLSRVLGISIETTNYLTLPWIRLYIVQKCE